MRLATGWLELTENVVTNSSKMGNLVNLRKWEFGWEFKCRDEEWNWVRRKDSHLFKFIHVYFGEEKQEDKVWIILRNENSKHQSHL